LVEEDGKFSEWATYEYAGPAWYCEPSDATDEDDEARWCVLDVLGVCNDWLLLCALFASYECQFWIPVAEAPFAGIIDVCANVEGSCGVGVDC
jgi:hypothetical protein